MLPTELEAWRKRLGLKQREAAKLLEIPFDTYQNYAYGRRRVPAFLAKYCALVEKEAAE